MWKPYAGGGGGPREARSEKGNGAPGEWSRPGPTEWLGGCSAGCLALAAGVCVGFVFGDGAVEGLEGLVSPDLGPDGGDFLLVLLADSQRDFRCDEEAVDDGGGFWSEELLGWLPPAILWEAYKTAVLNDQDGDFDFLDAKN
ncbi:uncharacterized protein G2W53_039018 [Senna tora]|uniref:Uncharacterized protein n=1 Tax=Senna tora TaxID=362788 RepID=A0A834W2H7_9FABA|nr:uncharacterized protein G2W53_039018 [Senna tora]